MGALLREAWLTQGQRLSNFRSTQKRGETPQGIGACGQASKGWRRSTTQPRGSHDREDDLFRNRAFRPCRTARSERRASPGSARSYAGADRVAHSDPDAVSDRRAVNRRSPSGFVIASGRSSCGDPGPGTLPPWIASGFALARMKGTAPLGSRAEAPDSDGEKDNYKTCVGGLGESHCTSRSAANAILGPVTGRSGSQA